jgi:phage/plasmid-associated DNA primase
MSVILDADEKNKILENYTPLHTYKENPTTDFKTPEVFCNLLEKSNMPNDIIEVIRYYTAGENNFKVVAYQLLGDTNTGKSTIVKYITVHFGSHAQQFCEDGKFTFSSLNQSLLCTI